MFAAGPGEKQYLQRVGASFLRGWMFEAAPVGDNTLPARSRTFLMMLTDQGNISRGNCGQARCQFISFLAENVMLQN